jgi:di/tripeptidase
VLPERVLCHIPNHSEVLSNLVQIDGIPGAHQGDEEHQGAGAVKLLLVGGGAQLAALAAEGGPGHALNRFALVLAALDTPLQLLIDEVAQDEKSFFDFSKLGQALGQLAAAASRGFLRGFRLLSKFRESRSRWMDYANA